MKLTFDEMLENVESGNIILVGHLVVFGLLSCYSSLTQLGNLIPVLRQITHF